MKISKKQLKKIIKEEKAKILEEQSIGRVKEDLDSMFYQFEREINSRLSLSNRMWYEDPEVVDALLEMLSELKANFSSFYCRGIAFSLITKV